MGYFSNLAVTYDHGRADHSYIAPQQQLRLRLEALEDRLAELEDLPYMYEGRAYYSEDALRYALPEDLKSCEAVEAAIELAVEDLAQKYRIFVRGEPTAESPGMDELTGMQITFVDLMALQALHVA